MASIAERLLPLRIRVPRVPVAVQFTREGLVFVLLSLAIGAAAVNTGNNILYLIFSTMLAMIVVSGLLSRRTLSGLSPRVEFPESLFAGVRNLCFVSVNNKKKRSPSLGIRFVLSGDGFPEASSYYFFIPPHSEVHSFVPVTFANRGLFTLKNLELQTRFPFSFFLKIRNFTPDQQVRVYPQIYRLSDDWIQRYTEGILFESPFRGESHQLLHLRDYAPNDSSKRIHWKASAKAEKFLVKEFLKEQGRELRIFFDCYARNEGQAPAMERAISLSASIAYMLRRRGLEAVFVFAERQFLIGDRDVQMIPLLDHLAEIQVGAPPDVTPYTGKQQEGHSLVIRSQRIARLLEAPPSVRVVMVEDTTSRMMEPLEDAAIKGEK